MRLFSSWMAAAETAVPSIGKIFCNQMCNFYPGREVARDNRKKEKRRSSIFERRFETLAVEGFVAEEQACQPMAAKDKRLRHGVCFSEND